MRCEVILALSLALASSLSAPGGQWMGWSDFLLAAMGELALGATLGLGILLAFAAFSIAVQLLDVQLGFGLQRSVERVR
jgi:flagellar biosynthesis protein FliR